MPTLTKYGLRRLIMVSGVCWTLVAGCLSDPEGPTSLVMVVMGQPSDSIWVGGPGEPLPTPMRIHVTDGRGSPVVGALVTWTPSGKGARVVAPGTVTNESGDAQAGWVLGVDASEEQQLRISVSTFDRQAQSLVRARGVPHVVSRLRFLPDTPAVLHVGDSLRMHFAAIDPYGNAFQPPDTVLAPADTTIARIAGSVLIAGPRRGRTLVTVFSQSVRDSLLVSVGQDVATIQPDDRVLRFTSLGETLPFGYEVLDDRGQLVQDTTVSLQVEDTSIASYDGRYIHSRGPGETMIALRLGSTVAGTSVQVLQVPASIKLTPDSIVFTALGDTDAVRVAAYDSLGFLIAHPSVHLSIDDSAVARVDGQGTVRSVGGGATHLTITDSLTSKQTRLPVIVRQAVVRTVIAVRSNGGFTFAAPDDSVGAIWAEDHNGYRVPVSAQIALSDSSRVAVDTNGVIRALKSGTTTITAIVDSLKQVDSVTVVLPVQVQSPALAAFTVAGLPDSLGVWAPTAIVMPDGTQRLFFTGYVYDSIQKPPFSGSLHYATSTDGVHFTYQGIALPRDSGYSGYRSQGVENVFLLPRDDGPGCRLLASAGSSWWIWQIYSAVSDGCDTWTWEDGPALPGAIESDTIGRPNGEGIYAWRDSTGQLWMLAGAYPETSGDVRTWTIALYRGTDERHWSYVRSVFYPGPPGSGRERAVFGPSVVAVAPGLYRMFFAGDDLGIGPDGGRSRIWSAVSHDRLEWVFEGQVLDLGLPTRGPRYPTVVGNHLYYVDTGPTVSARLGVAQILQP